MTASLHAALPGTPPTCSFCGFGEKQVYRLFSGPAAMICDECAIMVVEKLPPERQTTEKQRAAEKLRLVCIQTAATISPRGVGLVELADVLVAYVRGGRGEAELARPRETAS